jgi:hypothetical protein
MRRRSLVTLEGSANDSTIMVQPSAPVPSAVQSKPESNQVQSQESSVKKERGTRIRRVVAVSISALGAILMVSSFWIPGMEVCRSSPVGPDLVITEVCNPWTISDLLPFVVVSLLLLLPDVSELSIPHFFTLKRQIEAQKAEIDATEAKQEVLESRIAHLNAVQTNSQSMENHNHYYPARPASELPEEIAEKVSSTQVNAENGPNSSMSAELDAENAESAMQLIREWEELSEELGLRNRGRANYRSNQEQISDDNSRRFLHTFKEEIDTVRLVRNSLAHGKYVNLKDVNGALAAVRELKRIWRNR